MDIKEFVSRTLAEIVDGVKEAQAGDDGMLVNAAISHGEARGEPGGHLFQGQFGTFTRIDFDLAVTVEAKDTKEGGGKLSVVGIGVGGKAGRENAVTSVSRVAFSVPVQLPDGDQSRLQEYVDRSKEESKQRDERMRAAQNRRTGEFP